MTDDEFLVALESCTLPEAHFGHAEHVRAGYLYLRRNEFPPALGRIRCSIRNFATHHGRPDRYHETITVAYLALIRQHIAERGDGNGWLGFARANPELFQPDLLHRYYPKSQLDAPLARSVFILPRAADPYSP